MMTSELRGSTTKSPTPRSFTCAKMFVQVLPPSMLLNSPRSQSISLSYSLPSAAANTMSGFLESTATIGMK